MPTKQHGRQYDIVLFGATGYTGKYTGEYITANLPTNLKWAIAGRSRGKLEELAAKYKALNPDRVQPEIEICGLTDGELDALAKKTFILITTVGPYGRYGEHAFKACAENGTHYLDITGEVAFVKKMIDKYEAEAKATGAMMFPQIGVDSAPSDLIAWSLAAAIRSHLSAPTGEVTVSIHTLDAAPSGGTLNTALTLFDNFTIGEVRSGRQPFALSPIPNKGPALKPRSLFTRLTGMWTDRNLGLLTTSIAALTDTPIVERSWGLLQTIPSTKSQFYGPNFSFRQFMRAKGWLHGLRVHFGLMFLGLVLVTPLLRRLALRFVYQPGEGPDVDLAKKDRVEYRAVAKPDVPGPVKQIPFCRAWFDGSLYQLTSVIVSEAALILLEEDVKLEGGVFTPACLGDKFIQRLDGAGFHIKTEMIAA